MHEIEAGGFTSFGQLFAKVFRQVGHFVEIENLLSMYPLKYLSALVGSDIQHRGDVAGLKAAQRGPFQIQHDV